MAAQPGSKAPFNSARPAPAAPAPGAPGAADEDERDDAPAPAPLILPPDCDDLADTDPSRGFRHERRHAALCYIPGAGVAEGEGLAARSDPAISGEVLIVSLDNLATIDEPWPRAPWMQWRLQAMGYSVLGVQSRAKDWFRQPDAPAMIAELARTGFFLRFRRVVFIGASMGGFGALNFAPLVPGSDVLAFSPQSTMNKSIAPYEARFRFAVRKSNWEGMPFLDAAAAVPYIPRVTLVFDPLVPEDRQHAARLSGANVRMVKLRHATHEAIRVVLKSDALPPLLAAVVEGVPPGDAFWRAYRARRGVRKWLRALTDRLAQANRPERTRRAARHILSLNPDLTFARQAARQAEATLAAAIPPAPAKELSNG